MNQSKHHIFSIVVRLEHHKKCIATHRDKLREILMEIESLDESFTQGLESLEAAVDSFSELV